MSEYDEDGYDPNDRGCSYPCMWCDEEPLEFGYAKDALAKHFLTEGDAEAAFKSWLEWSRFRYASNARAASPMNQRVQQILEDARLPTGYYEDGDE